jgi:hypothetical protein
MRSLAIILLLPLLAFADQVKRVEHQTLWLQGDAKTIVGGTISQTEEIDLFIDHDGGEIMPNRATVWVSGSNDICEDDTITVYVYGSFNYVTVSCLDTVNVPIDTLKSGTAEFSFTLASGDGLVDKIKLGFTPEGASADDSCAIFTKVVLEYTQDITINSVVDMDSTWEQITVNSDIIPDADNGADIGTNGTSMDSIFCDDLVVDATIGVPANSISDDELDEGSDFDWTGDQTFAGRIILPLHTIAEGDSVLGHMILDAADTTLKMYDGGTWEVIEDLTD